MNESSKISPAFEAFLSESGPQDKRAAIVVCRRPKPKQPRPKGRLRVLQERLDAVKAQSKSQARVQATMTKAYQKEVGPDFETAPIGGSALPVSWVEVTRKSLDTLKADPNVVAILPDQKVHLIQPAAQSFARPDKKEIKSGMTWGLEELDIPKMWKTSKGRGITVGVLDTGVYAVHDALKGRVQDFIVVDPLGRRITASEPFDAGDHGTHVCGTVAGGKSPDGVSIGIAPESELLVAAVLLESSSLRAVVEGMSWAYKQGASVLNLSLGVTYYDPLLEVLIETLLDDDVLSVVAIGNECHGNMSSPGSSVHAFSVGAVEKGEKGKLMVAPFSSGASLLHHDDEGPWHVDKPDIAAPGAHVFSCIPRTEEAGKVYEYKYMDGTSMATPHVAGVAALLMAAKPEAPVRDVAEALRSTAWHPFGNDYCPDNRWGYGLIQPADALAAL